MELLVNINSFLPLERVDNIDFAFFFLSADDENASILALGEINTHKQTFIYFQIVHTFSSLGACSSYRSDLLKFFNKSVDALNKFRIIYFLRNSRQFIDESFAFS